jgi:hypothetical protein
MTRSQKGDTNEHAREEERVPLREVHLRLRGGVGPALHLRRVVRLRGDVPLRRGLRLRGEEVNAR